MYREVRVAAAQGLQVGSNKFVCLCLSVCLSVSLSVPFFALIISTSSKFLQIIAGKKFDRDAAKAISENFDAFFNLCGMCKIGDAKWGNYGTEQGGRAFIEK